MAQGTMLWLLAQALMVLIPLVLSLTVHEYAHGRAARALGDDTAERAGRLTLNPLAHADPIGTVLLPLAILMANGATAGSLPFFGWAKPTPVNAARFTRRVSVRVGSTWVAAAGPLANLGLALLCACWLAADQRAWLGPAGGPALARLAWSMLSINVALCLFNLLPLQPLDGATVVSGFLRPAQAFAFDRFNQQYGTWILWGLILFARDWLAYPIVQVSRGLLALVGVG